MWRRILIGLGLAAPLLHPRLGKQVQTETSPPRPIPDRLAQTKAVDDNDGKKLRRKRLRDRGPNHRSHRGRAKAARPRTRIVDEMRRVRGDVLSQVSAAAPPGEGARPVSEVEGAAEDAGA